MINYLLRETKSQEDDRLDRLLLSKDFVNYSRLLSYYSKRDEYIKGVK